MQHAVHRLLVRQHITQLFECARAATALQRGTPARGDCVVRLYEVCVDVDRKLAALEALVLLPQHARRLLARAAPGAVVLQR
ncbi:hypothetical protein PMAYCL1PPCAC_14396 [Pristionchus mayeri]|uniref:Uncharacterized protein n=1 Tax=Pristionchus mayeri TaxID=1317129 RepID=A0AAN4ZS89_9BILA|nr:hypothetical protein PMAYCL1PPCAC_14396 [Pristionchus mayeri]